MISLKLSPNVRIRLTLLREMSLDQNNEIFNDELLKNYLDRHSEATNRQHALTKSVLLIDLALAAIVSGKNFRIPGLDLNLNEIPAAQETLSIAASFAFLMLSYGVPQFAALPSNHGDFCAEKAEKHLVDPDFISAGKIHTELFVKAFRPKLNFFGSDFFIASRAFNIYHSMLTYLLLLSVLSLIAIHFVLVPSPYIILRLVAGSFGHSCACFIMNLTAVLFPLDKSFNFDVPKPIE